MKKTIELTEQEANVILQALDLTVKNQGLNFARPALFIHDKLQEAFKKEPGKEGEGEDGTE